MKKPPRGRFFRPKPLSQLNDDGKGGVVIQIEARLDGSVNWVEAQGYGTVTPATSSRQAAARSGLQTGARRDRLWEVRIMPGGGDGGARAEIVVAIEDLAVKASRGMGPKPSAGRLATPAWASPPAVREQGSVEERPDGGSSKG